MKVEVELEGKKVKVYEFERYDLWKLHKIKVNSDIEKAYKAKLEEELNKPEVLKRIGNTQYESLNYRVSMLEKEVQELKNSKTQVKEEKKKPETKEKKQNIQTK